VVVSLLGDRATYRRGALRASWRRFKVSPMMRREVWDQLRDYNRPDFHPDDSDTNALVEQWRAELFGDNGSLNDKLMGAAA
jgi:predicted metal-dependent hydrolase